MLHIHFHENQNKDQILKQFWTWQIRCITHNTSNKAERTGLCSSLQMVVPMYSISVAAYRACVGTIQLKFPEIDFVQSSLMSMQLPSIVNDTCKFFKTQLLLYVQPYLKLQLLQFAHIMYLSIYHGTRLARPVRSTNRLYITFTWWRKDKDFSKTSAYQVHLLNYWLTPWSRVLLEKLTVSQPAEKFPTFYGTRRFITAFTSTRHLSLSWAPPNPLPEDPA